MCKNEMNLHKTSFLQKKFIRFNPILMPKFIIITIILCKGMKYIEC